MTDSSFKDAKMDLILGISYLVLVVLFIQVFAIPYTLLLAGGGAEDASLVSKFIFYGGVAIASVLVFIGVKLARTQIGDKKKRDWYDAPIHDPEKSITASGKGVFFLNFFYKVNKSKWLLFLFALLLFIPFVSIGSYYQQTALEGDFITILFPQTAFPGAGFFTEQQVTETADVGLSVYPASPTETLFQIAIQILVMLGAGYAAFTRKWITPDALPFFKWLVAPIMGALSHLIDHLFRYGGDEVSLTAVLIFGILTAYMYVFFQSVIVPLVYHDVTNLILKLFKAGYLGSDASIGVMVLLYLLLVVIFVVSYRGFKSSSGTPQPT